MFRHLGQPVPNVRKIVVLRANALGDFIFILPALQALRDTYSQAEIVLIGKLWHVAFLENRPGPVDRVVVLPGITGVGEPPDYVQDDQQVAEFYAEMRAEKFDIALQMHGGGRYSNPFMLELGARVTAGLKTPDAAALDRNVPYIYFQHEVLRYLEVAALVGARGSSVEPELCVTDEDMKEAELHFKGDNRPLVLLQPGATDPRRRWPAERFAAVGDALAARGARVAVNGADWEVGLVQEVLSRMKSHALDLGGRLSLKGLTGVLAQASLAVSNDTGPLHLARAVGAPTVGIYWCGNMINAGAMTRTWHRNLVSWRRACPVCGQDNLERRCEHNESFIDEVSVDEVLEAALDLLPSVSLQARATA